MEVLEDVEALVVGRDAEEEAEELAASRAA